MERKASEGLQSGRALWSASATSEGKQYCMCVKKGCYTIQYNTACVSIWKTITSPFAVLYTSYKLLKNVIQTTSLLQSTRTSMLHSVGTLVKKNLLDTAW